MDGGCSRGSPFPVTCHHPLRAYRAAGGQVSFRKSEGYSDLPLSFACGKCLACRVERSRSWALRCVHEAQMHSQNCFVTLTYCPSKLPADGSLNVRDYQLFMKRLRKRLGSAASELSYFMAGEYGDVNLRPHYHALLFGVDFSGDKVLHSRRGGNNIYVSKTLEDIWGLGFCTVGDVTFQSAAYVARYVLKKFRDPNDKHMYERVDGRTGEVYLVKPEFAVMSRRPAIGKRWFEKFSDDVFPSDEVVLCGKRHKVPRYYNSLLERSDPAQLEVIKARRLSAVKARAEDLTPERMESAEIILEQKVGLLKRDI